MLISGQKAAHVALNALRRQQQEQGEQKEEELVTA